jgi:hypothetical protein
VQLETVIDVVSQTSGDLDPEVDVIGEEVVPLQRILPIVIGSRTVSPRTWLPLFDANQLGDSLED